MKKVVIATAIASVIICGSVFSDENVNLTHCKSIQLPKLVPLINNLFIHFYSQIYFAESLKENDC